MTFHGSKHDVIIHKDDEHQSNKVIARRSISNTENVAYEDSSFLGHRKPCKVENGADLIDKMSRALFPLIFLIFNIGYWSYYTNAN